MKAVWFSQMHLSLLLLLQLGLNTTLTSLSLIVHILPLLLAILVTKDSRANSAHSATGTISHTLTQIRELALGLLGLSVGILLYSGLTQVLVSDQVANGLLGGADGLVPGSRGAVLVVADGGAGIGVCGEGAHAGGGVGVFVFLLGLGFAGVCFGLDLILYSVSKDVRG